MKSEIHSFHKGEVLFFPLSRSAIQFSQAFTLKDFHAAYTRKLDDRHIV